MPKHTIEEINLDDVEDEELLEEIRVEKEDFKSVLNKKKLTKWELDDAFLGQI